FRAPYVYLSGGDVAFQELYEIVIPFDFKYIEKNLKFDCSIGSAKYSHDEIWTIPEMNYSVAMPDYKVFDLKVTSSGG
ncbi:hypothetical protein NAI57_11675, partial [Francisella tularensis subsp. holarctica]|nr:hypothetical protein [Francisella tularensis subsp. holarctica]